jgi:hypothetical protein
MPKARLQLSKRRSVSLRELRVCAMSTFGERLLKLPYGLAELARVEAQVPSVAPATRRRPMYQGLHEHKLQLHR